jgi:hypothetical protein
MMKLPFVIFLQMLFSIESVAQFDTASLNALQSLIRHYQKSGTIYYGKYDPGLAKDKFDFLLSRKEFSRSDRRKITLTFDERSQLLKELNKFQTFELKDSLFENSSKIPSDSLISLTVKLNKIKIDSFYKAGDSLSAWKYMTSNSQYCSFLFTRPIYLKNKTIMVFCFAWMVNHNGDERLSFYKKTGMSWQKWKTIILGAY